MPKSKDIEVDADVYLSANYADDWQSETTSIGTSIYNGLMENGRRYQTLSDKEYLYACHSIRHQRSCQLMLISH
ncbi:hypothetical protein VN97_g9585 [Penicillium thymicola]|uniref:Uncharacterized protein n=1 Tax=Penicillium thymicola TaxID=293382 RepID=A0AAI9TBF7_PENTH|nr:hypothetical protein VN97_g9585 [Penicillium thymicola]